MRIIKYLPIQGILIAWYFQNLYVLLSRLISVGQRQIVEIFLNADRRAVRIGYGKIGHYILG